MFHSQSFSATTEIKSYLRFNASLRTLSKAYREFGNTPLLCEVLTFCEYSLRHSVSVGCVLIPLEEKEGAAEKMARVILRYLGNDLHVLRKSQATLQVRAKSLSGRQSVVS